jgi:hypothetical protein
MSRTKKGKRSPGYEYWGKRPNSGCTPGKEDKKITHQIERAQAKQKLHKEKKDN